MKPTQYVVMIVLFTFVLSGCERDAPTDGGQTGSTPIPSSMPQVDIPWPSLANSPWPMQQHDPQRTGRSPFRGPQLGQIEWAANPAREYQLETAIAIGSDNTLYYSSPFNHLVALNPDSTERWVFRLDGWPSYTGPHILSDGSIWISTDRADFLYGFSANGALRSRVALPAWSVFGVTGKDGRLYGVGVEDKKLYALTTSGTVVWSLFLNGGFSSATLTALSPDGSTIYLGSAGSPGVGIADSGLYAISTSGELVWRNDLGGSRFFGFLIDNQGNIYVMPEYPGEVLSLSPDGATRWLYKFAPSNYNGYLTMDDNGYIYLTDNANGRIISLDYAGKKRWEMPYPPRSGGELVHVDSPIVCDNEGTVYVLFSYASTDQNIQAIRSNGQKLWVSSLPHVEGFPTDIFSQPSIGSNEHLYLAHEYDRRIYALR